MKHVRFLTALLLAAGLGLFAYKALGLRLPLVPSAESSVWTVEAQLSFVGRNRPVKVTFPVPPAQAQFARLDENFVSRNYGITTYHDGGNRVSTWTIRRATGAQALYYRLVVYREDVSDHLGEPSAPAYPDGLVLEEPRLAAAEALIERVRARSANSLTFAIEVVKALLDEGDGNAAVLLERDATPQNIARVAVEVLKGARIPARMVHGIRLGTGEHMYRRQVPLETLLSIWNGEAWLFVDPVHARPGLPDDFLIWAYGDAPLFSVEGARDKQIRLATTHSLQNALEIVQSDLVRDKSQVLSFSLFNLPLHIQSMFRVLLTVPVGAFIILLLRSFIGVQTFGTFMPVLVAMAFRETQLLWGLVLFTVVVALGLSVRFYLERLKLLLIPRLTAVLCFVILLMAVLSMVSYRLGLENGLSIALFPMVIITMTVERMSIVWEERDGWTAIKQGLGSMAAASLAYFAMSNRLVEHLVFVFPELLLLIICMTMLVGRYRGYRLSELLRFQALARARDVQAT